MRSLTLLLWAVGLAMLAVGLYLIVKNHNNSSSTQTVTTTPTTTVKHPPPRQRPAVPTVAVYEVQGGLLRVHALPVRTGAVDPATALSKLNIPGTVTVANGTATVVGIPKPHDPDAAGIVWTLTQFDTVKRVKLPGYGLLTRADEAKYVPPIFVESPVDRVQVPKTFHVRGSASVFEGTIVVKLVASGKTYRKTVTATAGAPDLGTFDTTLTVTSGGPATLTLYAPSAQNGTPQHEITERLSIAQ